MAKKIIYLSLKDLKELGIIKKRRRRKTQLLKPIIQQGIRQSSEHMQGFSNYFNNTTNLATKNLEETNRALVLRNNSTENDILKNKNTGIEFNNQLSKLERDISNQQNNFYYLNGQMVKYGFSNDDNIDVPESNPIFHNQGYAPKDTSQVEDITEPPPNEYMFYDVSSPLPVKEGGPIPDKTRKQITEENRQILRDELISLGETDDDILKSKNQVEMKNRIKKINKEITTLIGYYSSLGGENKKIITSKSRTDINNAIKKLEKKKNKI